VYSGWPCYRGARCSLWQCRKPIDFIKLKIFFLCHILEYSGGLLKFFLRFLSFNKR
jgi:hypothetical protein